MRVEGRTAAPILDVGVYGNSSRTTNCRGVIDTGASITMITPSVIDALDLSVMGSIPLAGITGAKRFPTYQIDMSIGGTVFTEILAAGFEGISAVGLKSPEW